MKRLSAWAVSIGLLVLGSVLGLWLAGHPSLTGGLRGESPSRAVPRKSPVPPEVQGDLETVLSISRLLSHVAEKVTPAVVSIHSLKLFSADELGTISFRQEKEDDAGRGRFKFQRPRQFRQEGTGSGVIISPDGYIITNFHVINHAQDIKVTLSDYRSFSAKVIGADRLSEVAVIKIDGENLPFARLGNSDSCRVGELVLAIGNPLDLSSTVTLGIISALGRRIDIIRDNFAIETFIQTDAAINPGNSGGALVNLHGEVIGINTAIATETGYDMGFGFAIPINLVKKISADLIRNGEVIRGYLGIAMQNIDEIQARALGLGKPRGVFVDDVFKGSPAAKADIRMMDVIVQVDGKPVNRANALQAYIARKTPGEEVRFTILRQGKRIERTVTLGLRQTERPRIRRSRRKQKPFSDLGMKLKPITEFDSIELGYPGTEGALVEAVARFSPAEQAGIQIDDIITRVNDIRIESPQHFREVLRRYRSGEVVIIRVFRASGNYHYFIEIP